MSDNKKYYYLKLKENFYDSEQVVVLESMPDGHLYSNILLKLYLRSLKNEGRLMFNERIPYNPTMLATITRHTVGVVEKALRIFRDLDLIEVLDNGAIYILDIQNFIGESSTEADRKRAYRKKISEERDAQIELPGGTEAIEVEEEEEENEPETGQMSGQISTRVRDRDRVKDRERDRDEKPKPAEKYPDGTPELEIAKALRRIMLEIKPDSKEPSLQEWAQHIDYLLRLDGKKPQQIIDLFEWAQNDDFWVANIRSTRKLRAKWDTLELQMKRPKKGQQQNDNLNALSDIYRRAQEEEEGE